MSALDPAIDGINSEIGRLRTQINDVRNREETTVQEVRQKLRQEVSNLESNLKKLEDEAKHLQATRDQINKM